MFVFTKTELKIFLTIFLVSFIFIHWMDWNSNSRLDLTRAILEEGRLEIDSYANNTGDRAYINGHYYIEKSPSTSLIIIPGYGSLRFIYHNFLENLIGYNTSLEYFTLKWGNTSILEPIYLDSLNLFSYILIILSISVLFTSLTTILIYKFSSFFLNKEWQRLFVSFAYWLGTLAFFYSLIFYNQPFPNFLAFLSFYILFKMKHSNKKKTLIFIAGMLLGLAILSEYAAVLFSIPFLLYVIYLTDKSKTLLFLIALIIGVLPLLIYNYIILGSPLRLTFEYIDPAGWEGSGLGGGTLGLNPLPNCYVFLRLLMYPEKGLLFYFPFLILSIFGFYFMLKKYRAEGLMILSMFILILTFFSAYKSWWEYTSFGPRRIFLITPFLMLPVIFSLKKIRFSFILILFFVSLFINTASLNQDVATFRDVFILPNSQAVNPEVMKKVSSLEIIDYLLLNHHFPNFLEIGPRSRLIESLLVENRMFDIRDYWPYNNLMEEPRILNIKLFTSQFGFVFMKTSFITTVITISMVFLVWKKELLKFVLNHKYLFSILFLLFLLFFFTITKTLYENNWFVDKFYGERTYHWMSDNATLRIYSPNEEEVALKFNAWTFYKDRTMEIYLNNELIRTFKTKVNETREFITPILKLRSEDNIIRFHSVQGCDMPAEVGAWLNDFKCLSFYFYGIEKLNAKDLYGKLIFIDWYLEEKDKSGNFRWMSNESNINYYVSDVTKINLTFSTRSYHENRSLDIYINDKFIKKVIVNVSWVDEKIMLNLNKGDNVISFNSVSGCDVPKEIEGTNDNRCLSFAFKDIKIE